MNTSDTLKEVCKHQGITLSELAKRTNQLPSTLSRKLSNETMTLKEFERCLTAAEAKLECSVIYPGEPVASREEVESRLLRQNEVLRSQLEATGNLLSYNNYLMKDFRTELNNIEGLVTLAFDSAEKNTPAKKYLERLQKLFAEIEVMLDASLLDEYNPQTVDMNRIARVLKGKKVLIVDDNRLNGEITTEVLTGHGLEVTYVESGQDAVDLLNSKQERFDFVFMDIEMPGMDGYETTRIIRGSSSKRIATIPVIAMTANAFPESIAKAKESGMNEFLPKPVNIRRVFNILSKY